MASRRHRQAPQVRAYSNPDTKCWFNSVMVLLTFFDAFHDTLASPDKSGPVVAMLKAHFHSPELQRPQGPHPVVATLKVVRNLRDALAQHMVSFPTSSGGAKQLLAMLSTTAHQDPGEFWTLLYSVVRLELAINADTSHIGVQVNNILRCTECQQSRRSALEAEQYLYHPLELRALLTAVPFSVQTALQSFFTLEEGVEARCCHNERNSSHDKLCECQVGASGLVVYAPFLEEHLPTCAARAIAVDTDIRLPSGGHSSGFQSAYELVGFTARYAARAHHVAVVYISGQPWTYDDGSISQGLPSEGWVPGLMFYKRWHPDLGASQSCSFAQLPVQVPQVASVPSAVASAAFGLSPTVLSSTHISKRGRVRQRTDRYKPLAQPRKDNQDLPQRSLQAASSPIQVPQVALAQPAVASDTFGLSPAVSSSTHISKRGRVSQRTDRYKPPEQPRKDTHGLPSRTLPAASSPGSSVAPPIPPSADFASAVPACTSTVSQPRQPRNKLAAQYPAGSWVWAKGDGDGPLPGSQGAYRIAKIVGPASVGCMYVEWACETGTVKIRNKAIYRAPTLAEERLLFPLPQDLGRLLTLAQVTSLLNSQGTSRSLSTLQPMSEASSSAERYASLIPTAATTNWKSLALPWLASDNTSFSPKALIGMPLSLPSKVPSDCFRPNAEFHKYPSFGNCIREIILIMQQLKPEDHLYQQLFAWLHSTPMLLLRAPRLCRRKALKDLIEKRCTLLLEGKWEQLYDQTVEDVDKLCLRRQKPTSSRPARFDGKMKRAFDCMRVGNLSKGVRILVGNGVSAEPQAYDELLAKHPQDVPPASFAPDYVIPALSPEEEEARDRLMSTANLAKVAGNFPAESHPDQWGWRAREYLSPLLHDPELGPLVRDILILPRCNNKLPALHGEYYRGGCLIPLSKLPKPGTRPINIGDAFRRLSDKALQPLPKSGLAHKFEHTYPNVKQFASGITDGAEKFLVTTMLALNEHHAPETPHMSGRDEDPMVILKLDAKNAFNTIHRQFVLDMIQGKVAHPYAKGRLTSHNITALPSSFAVHIPSIMAHYVGDGTLTFVAANGEVRQITSRTGVHQGCVLGGKLFNIGTFSLVGATMADHPNVYCPMFSDNLALVGRLSKVFAAADDLRESLLEIGLSLQPADSAIYIPSFVREDQPPALLEALRLQYPEFHDIPWQRDGIVLLGCPVGTNEFVHNIFEQVCDGIEHRIEQFARVDDGLIHLQLIKFSVNSMLPYFLRTTSPELTALHARRIDDRIWRALLDFSDVPNEDRHQQALRSIFADARCQVTLSISEGGFGITPNECVATTAFYSGVSRALRFAATACFPPITDYLASPAFLSHPLYVAYAKARQDLISWGALEPEQAQSLDAETPPAGGTQKQLKYKHRPPVLPAIADVLVYDSSKQVVFPDQKTLTRTSMKAHKSWSPAGLTEPGQHRVEHLRAQALKARSDEDDTAKYLQTIANFPDDLQLRQSPLAFLSHTDSLSEKFPRDVFSVLFCFLLGLRAPLCLQTHTTYICEGCGQHMDAYGHHRMSCAKTSSYHVAHNLLAEAFADIARKSGVPFTDKNVPHHLDTEKVGDALINLSDDSRQLILDYTIVHPVRGTGVNAAGNPIWNDKARAFKVRDKWNRHGSHYDRISFAFAPCVMTTYGQMDAHLLRLLYILAKRRAEAVHVHQRPFTHPEHLFGLFFAQSRARIGAAVARGMALRALGCSLMGVSKVFLRHIAPARYKDQTLSAGEHLAAGFSQWRLALAV